MQSFQRSNEHKLIGKMMLSFKSPTEQQVNKCLKARQHEYRRDSKITVLKYIRKVTAKRSLNILAELQQNDTAIALVSIFRLFFVSEIKYASLYRV